MLDKCRVIWIDHHDTSVNLISKFENYGMIDGIVSKEHSAAYLAYQFFYPEELVPRFIAMVSDYDTWQNKELPYNRYFVYGLQGLDWKTLDNQHSVWYTLLKAPERTKVFQSITKNGEAIYSYILRNNEEKRKQNAYITEFEGHSALVMNADGNSLIFGEDLSEYDIYILWNFDGNVVWYCLYSAKDSVDCSAIAEKYGGGGHKGAAGFISKELLFV